MFEQNIERMEKILFASSASGRLHAFALAPLTSGWPSRKRYAKLKKQTRKRLTGPRQSAAHSSLFLYGPPPDQRHPGPVELVMAIKDIYQAVLDYDDENIASLVNKEIEAGTELNLILRAGLIEAMDEVGQNFSQGEIFVPEMLLAAETMKIGLELLKPGLAARQTTKAGTVVIGTVKGDLHDIGKNLVGMLLEGGGFEVHDLGVDVAPDDFVAALKNHRAAILGLSALLTTTMPAMAATVAAVRGAGLSGVKIMIGGAPVTADYADRIGADGFSGDAPGAVELARSFSA